MSLAVAGIVAVFVIVLTIFSSVLFKDKEKVDKGFELVYFKLSYRRKLIRTFIILPALIGAYLVLYFLKEWSLAMKVIIGLLFILLIAVQLVYNFMMWKRTEAED